MKPTWLRGPKYCNPKPPSCDPKAQRRIGSRSVSDRASTEQWLRTTLILGTLCECWTTRGWGTCSYHWLGSHQHIRPAMVPNTRH